MIETLAALFAIGTWGFLGVLAAFVIALIVFAEEDGVKATVTLVLGALFLQFIAKFDLLTLIREQPFTLLFYIGLYIVIGLVWSVVKWSFYVKAQRRIYDRLRKKFCAESGITGEFTLEQKGSWYLHLRENYRPNKGSTFKHYSSSDSTAVIPDVTENKAAIIRWMTYWPFSLLFTLLNDPVRRLFEWVYENIGTFLQAMAVRAFHGTENDQLTKDEQALLEKQQYADPSRRGR